MFFLLNIIIALLSLLEKFEISFPLPPIVHDKNQKYFIPCLVTSEKPENINLPTTNYISRVYRFDFLPFGFFHRLIVLFYKCSIFY